MRVYRRKGIIKPVYIREPIAIIETLIEVYKDHVNQKRGALKETLSDCEHLGYDYRLVRGLVALLDNRAVFQTRCSMPPIEARRQVFTEAASTVVATREDRLVVLERVAKRNGLTVEMLEDCLYADLDDEKYLVDFAPPSPLELMKIYNYANTVALLAYSLHIVVSCSEWDEYLEHLLKQIGDAEITRSRTKASIQLKPTKRLSKRAEKIDAVLSHILDKPPWRLEATIKYPQRYKTLCVFQIDSEGDGKLLMADKTRRETIIEVPGSRRKPKYGEIVVLDEAARRYGVTVATVKRDIQEEGIEYIDLNRVLITPEKHAEVRERLKQISTLGEARRYFKALGVRDFIPVLETYGYQIEGNPANKNSGIYRL